MSNFANCDNYPSNGVHDILAGHLPVGTKPWSPTVTNIVVDKPFAPFHFKYLGPNPGCVYEINLGNGPNKQWLTHDGQWVNINGSYSQWILKRVSGDVYTITLNGSDLCWTDMGPGSQPDRQLQLHPCEAGNHSQEFRIL